GEDPLPPLRSKTLRLHRECSWGKSLFPRPRRLRLHSSSARLKIAPFSFLGPVYREELRRQIAIHRSSPVLQERPGSQQTREEGFAPRQEFPTRSASQTMTLLF